MASGSSWSRFPLITLSAVTRDQRHRQGDEPYAADADDASSTSWQLAQRPAARDDGRRCEPAGRAARLTYQL